MWLKNKDLKCCISEFCQFQNLITTGVKNKVLPEYKMIMLHLWHDIVLCFLFIYLYHNCGLTFSTNTANKKKDVVEICNSASWLLAGSNCRGFFLKKWSKHLCDLPGPCSVLTFSFYVYLIETVTFLLKSESDRGTFNVNQQLLVFYI